MLMRCAKEGAYEWEPVSPIPCRYGQNKLHLSLTKASLGIDADDFSLEFKWSDNLQEKDVMDFYVNGDCAPRGRMNYVYFF